VVRRTSRCAGRLTLQQATGFRAYGSAAYSLAPGTRTVVVRVSASVRRQVRRAGRLSAAAVANTAQPGGGGIVVTQDLLLVRGGGFTG